MAVNKQPANAQSKLNKLTLELEEYPMEELARIKKDLIKKGRPVFDFGTGDPKIPTWEPIREACVNAIPQISQYPSVKGPDDLRTAQQGYLERRFEIKPDSGYSIIPSSGSKEAIFHIAMCLVGRSGGKKHIVYPDPGYPVYRSSTKFAHGIPMPIKLSESNGYLLEPWDMPPYIQRDCAAIWLNYPQNPTGATANKDYWKRVVEWAHRTDTILLSDDCYIDIYNSEIDNKPVENDEEDERPACPLQFSSDRVLTFQSLSKRSGMTGYRSGFIAGDSDIVKGILKARANFGVGSPDFISSAAVAAWNDDEHVRERRKIFTNRIKMAAPVFQELGLLEKAPDATFYLWTKIPQVFGTGDVRYCLGLAEHGVICSPSSWLSESIKGYARFALVPEEESLAEALQVIKDYINS
jgi:succinyldiaminopimelate transaminase